MRLVVDNIAEHFTDIYYMDVVLSIEELEQIRDGEMVQTSSRVEGRQFYVGIIKDRKFYEEESTSGLEFD